MKNHLYCDINDLAEVVQVMDELGGVTLVGRWWWGGAGVPYGGSRANGLTLNHLAQWL